MKLYYDLSRKPRLRDFVGLAMTSISERSELSEVLGRPRRSQESQEVQGNQVFLGNAK